MLCANHSIYTQSPSVHQRLSAQACQVPQSCTEIARFGAHVSTLLRRPSCLLAIQMENLLFQLNPFVYSYSFKFWIPVGQHLLMTELKAFKANFWRTQLIQQTFLGQIRYLSDFTDLFIWTHWLSSSLWALLHAWYPKGTHYISNE